MTTPKPAQPDTEGRERDLDIARAARKLRQQLWSLDGFDHEAHERVIADALAERERSVWQRVLDMCPKHYGGVDCAVERAQWGLDTNTLAITCETLLTILRAAQSDTTRIAAAKEPGHG